MDTNTDIIIEDLVMIIKEQININYPIQIEELKPYIVSFNSDFKDLSLFDMCFELGKFLIEMLDYHSEIFSDEQLYYKFATRFLFPPELFIDNCRKPAANDTGTSPANDTMQRSEIEIMAPVGSYEALAAAIQAGADSVYFGVGKLNMRSASAANFTLDDLAKIVATAHAAGVKTYLTVNTIVYEDEMLTVHEVIDRAKAEGIDAIIATDFAAILYARRIGVEVHISTQSNISNSETVKFFSQWADTVVLARELTLEQVAQIHRQIVENDIRGPRGELVGIEMFAHGALCMSISGKCYLSLYETNCSANRGACRQLCRRKYTVTDTETGAALDIDGRYVLSPKDLCTVDFLDRFIGAGVRVLKIEGRARGAEYVKRVVSCYDEALRAIEAGTYTPALAAGLKERLATVFNRGFWEG